MTSIASDISSCTYFEVGFGKRVYKTFDSRGFACVGPVLSLAPMLAVSHGKRIEQHRGDQVAVKARSVHNFSSSKMNWSRKKRSRDWIGSGCGLSHREMRGSDDNIVGARAPVKSDARL